MTTNKYKWIRVSIDDLKKHLKLDSLTGDEVDFSDAPYQIVFEMRRTKRR